MASKTDLGEGKWRIRWYNRVPRGAKRDQRERPFYGDELEADAICNRIAQAVRRTGYFDWDEDQALQGPPAPLLDGIAAYIDARKHEGDLAASSAVTMRRYRKALAWIILDAYGYDKDDVPPVTLLGRDLFSEVKGILIDDGYSRSYIAGITGLLMGSWEWMADSPRKWSRVPTPPYNRRSFLGVSAQYGRTVAPTLDDCDAVLRVLAGRTGRREVDPSTLVIALLMRYTGIRVGQLLAAEASDLDAERRCFHVRKGKSKEEQADARTVPVCGHLFEEPVVQEYLATLPSDGPLILRQSHPTRTLRAAWEDSAVDPEVWAPSGRVNARPNHAFRASVIAHLVDDEVRDDVIDFLVGHRDGVSNKTRATHYGRDLLRTAREVVDRLPPVGWDPDAPAMREASLNGAQEAAEAPRIITITPIPPSRIPD